MKVAARRLAIKLVKVLGILASSSTIFSIEVFGSDSISEQDLLGAWYRVRTSCGARLNRGDLKADIHSGNPAMPVRSTARFIDTDENSYEFEISTYPGIICTDSSMEHLTPTDQQYPLCRTMGVETSRGRFEIRKTEGSNEPRLFLKARPGEDQNFWGRTNDLHQIHFEGGLLIISVGSGLSCTQYGFCNSFCPPGQVWHSYYIPWPNS
jgi:hypothetical protein